MALDKDDFIWDDEDDDFLFFDDNICNCGEFCDDCDGNCEDCNCDEVMQESSFEL